MTSKKLTQGFVAEWTGKYDYTFYGFHLEYYWVWSVSRYREALPLKLVIT